MTKMRHILSYLLLAALTLSVASCGSSPLDKAVKRALVQQDTTQAQFDSICGIIQQSPDRYRQYLDDKGQINIAELQALFDRIGGELRPPMRWDISAYGQQELSLTIYFERSGSMVPYDNAGDRGQLKKAVNDIINQFPGRKVSINIVNDNIYPYQAPSTSLSKTATSMPAQPVWATRHSPTSSKSSGLSSRHRMPPMSAWWSPTSSTRPPMPAV